MSEVKVNKLSPRSGTTVTLGDSGDTISIPSGVTLDASSGGLAGTLTTAAQPNITSVGTLTSFTSTGIDDNATSTAITIDSANNATFSGIVTADQFNLNGGGDLHSTIDTSSVTVAGGTNSNVGANVNLYGSTHASLANVVRFRAGSSENMRIDSSGHAIIPAGVTLGTSAGTYNASNTLDDYEEGTWTPVFAGSTSAGTYTYSEQQGHYVKVGKLVTAWFNLTNITTSSAGSGGLQITGLPFSANWEAGFDGRPAGSMEVNGFTNITGNHTFASLVEGDSVITIRLSSGTNNFSTAVDVTHKYANTSDLRGVLTYRTT